MNEKLPTPPADGYQLTEAEVIGAVFDAGPEGVKLIDKWGVTAEWFTIPNGRQMLEVVRDVIGQGGRRDDSDMPDTLRQTAKRLFQKRKIAPAPLWPPFFTTPQTPPRAKHLPNFRACWSACKKHGQSGGGRRWLWTQ